MVCESVQTRFEDLWLTPRAIRTLVLELQPGSLGWTSCSPEDCRRVGQFCYAEGLAPARPYCLLSIWSMGSWTTRRAASTSAWTKISNTYSRKCLISVGTSRTLKA